MAHSEFDAPEADVAPSTLSMEDAAAAFEDDFEDAPAQGNDDEEDFEEDFDEGDEPDAEDSEEEGDEDSDEQDEQPAIEAPVSLNAEEKEVFAQLPPEAQQAWAASETRRNSQVQEATTKAKDAQRQAEQAAASANRQAEARYAEQLKQVTAAFAPQEPDPSRFQDIQSYQRAKLQYDDAKAQHEQFEQQVAQIGVETDEMKAERIKARDAELLKIPEVADEATRDTYIQSAFAVATELGYDQAELAENMDANDLKALGLAAKWKADSEELTKVKARSKERRRDNKTGKFKPTLKPGTEAGARPSKNNKAHAVFRANPSNMKAAAAAFEDI